MMSNKGLNSNEALDDSTATNSSVTLSGIRREKEAPTDLDIENYSRNPRICDHRRGNAGLTADYTDLTDQKSVSKVGDTLTFRLRNAPARQAFLPRTRERKRKCFELLLSARRLTADPGSRSGLETEPNAFRRE